MKFTTKEIKDLFWAWILVSLGFTILFSGLNIDSFFFISFIISSLTVGIGFLFHELMHKYLAQKYHLSAEFRASYNMLFLALIMSFFGFIIAAPGAVYIHGFTTKEKNGKISLAGPLANALLAFLFLIPLFALDLGEITDLFFNYGFKINALLAIFNMLPFLPFDGAKVLAWDKRIYYIVLIFVGGLFIGSFFI